MQTSWSKVNIRLANTWLSGKVQFIILYLRYKGYKCFEEIKKNPRQDNDIINIHINECNKRSKSNSFCYRNFISVVPCCSKMYFGVRGFHVTEMFQTHCPVIRATEPYSKLRCHPVT